VAAISAFTRVFDALWRPSKGDGNQVGFADLPTQHSEIGQADFGWPCILRGSLSLAPRDEDLDEKTVAVDRYFGGVS
jgi:hypothetical protein